MSDICVSLIIPVYNVDRFVKRCINSAIQQDFNNIEIILVDDGSLDNCPYIIDDFCNYQCNIITIHKINGGLSSARLSGFEVASGDYILFVDSDDYIDRTMVKTLVNKIEEQEAELAMCAFVVNNNGKETISILPYHESLNDRNAVISDYIIPLVGSSKSGINIPGFLCIRLLKRSLIKPAFFGSERQYFMEDHYFDLLYADGVRKVAIVNQPLYFYCINRSSLSNRFRANKWKMYDNLYAFYMNYVSSRNLFVPHERLEHFAVDSVLSTIDNGVLSGSYKVFRSEIDIITESPGLYRLFLSANPVNYPATKRVIFFLYKRRLYLFLYIMRKIRIASLYM